MITGVALEQIPEGADALLVPGTLMIRVMKPGERASLHALREIKEKEQVSLIPLDLTTFSVASRVDTNVTVPKGVGTQPNENTMVTNSYPAGGPQIVGPGLGGTHGQGE